MLREVRGWRAFGRLSCPADLRRDDSRPPPHPV